MTFKILKALFAVIAVSAWLCAAQERPSVFVDEAGIRAVLKDDSTVVNISISNSADHSVAAGGSSFSFNLSARMPMRAKTEPSSLYDYYNPEARSQTPPILWTVE